MAKLITVKLDQGSFQDGFPVMVQFGNESDRPSFQMMGHLPAAPEIPHFYQNWQKAYLRLGLPLRLGVPENQITNVSILGDCQVAERLLGDQLNQWLNHESLRRVKEQLLTRLDPRDTIRVLVQTTDYWLQRLPWHLWDFFDHFPRAEVALGCSMYQQVTAQPHRSRLGLLGFKPVKILAILGSSTGINVEADRQFLEQLPGAEVKFLVQPQRQVLNDQLWEQGWDILCFAGHSGAQVDSQTGHLWINDHDSLTIAQLKYALAKAVDNGLKLAILNSCDGLALARDLAELHLPQLIVMREPVVDQVAQAFLRYLLESYARGTSLYLSVRAARQRLQGLEDQFPSATWLPVICQNPAEIPPTWQELQGITPPSDGARVVRSSWCDRRAGSPISLELFSSLQRVKSRLLPIVLMAACATSLVLGLRYLGWLQSLELQAFDQLLRLRPTESPDPRLLIVKVTEADVQAQDATQRQGSLSDAALSQLLRQLDQYQPAVIGLDIYHDYPVQPEQAALAKRLRQPTNLVAVCKGSHSDVQDPGVPPPPEMPITHLGFSDVVLDPDQILRRQLLGMSPEPAAACASPYALATQLAFRYLHERDITPQFTPEGFLRLEQRVFRPLEAHWGGYQRDIDPRGHQILLNYRVVSAQTGIAEQVTLAQVLAGQLRPEAVRDRIVLIGTTAESFHDYVLTPFGEMPGVVNQAQMVSHLLSAVLDGRPLLSVWPGWGEGIWIGLWACLGSVVVVAVRSRSGRLLGYGIILTGLVGSCLYGLIQGIWLPLVPSALAVGLGGASMLVYSTLGNQDDRQLEEVLTCNPGPG